MWKEIKLFEFVMLRGWYPICVKTGDMFGGGHYAEWAKDSLIPSMIRWELTKRGSRWFKKEHSS